MPSDYPPRIRIQNDRQVNESLRQPDVGDVRYPQLIHSREDHRSCQISIDLQPMCGVRGHHELPLHHAYQIIFAHQSLYPFAIYFPAAGFQLLGHAPAPVGRPFQRHLLHLITQIHLRCGRRCRIPKTVVARAAESRHLAHPHQAQPATHLQFFFDLLVEGAPLFSACSRRCSSTCCKARFKKSISRACWPIFRSNSAIRPSSFR
jgi:hypothetical protein